MSRNLPPIPAEKIPSISRDFGTFEYVGDTLSLLNSGWQPPRIEEKDGRQWEVFHLYTMGEAYLDRSRGEDRATYTYQNVSGKPALDLFLKSFAAENRGVASFSTSSGGASTTFTLDLKAAGKFLSAFEQFIAEHPEYASQVAERDQHYQYADRKAAIQPRIDRVEFDATKAHFVESLQPKLAELRQELYSFLPTKDNPNADRVRTELAAIHFVQGLQKNNKSLQLDLTRVSPETRAVFAQIKGAVTKFLMGTEADIAHEYPVLAAGMKNADHPVPYEVRETIKTMVYDVIQRERSLGQTHVFDAAARGIAHDPDMKIYH